MSAATGVFGQLDLPKYLSFEQQSVRKVRLALVALLASVTILERFGLALGSDYSLNAAIMGCYAFLAVAAFRGSLRISEVRLSLYCVCVGVAATSLFINETFYAAGKSSVASLMLLVMMYFPYAFVLRQSAVAEDDAKWAANAFLNLAFLSACFGIGQFYLQYVWSPPWLFDFGPYLPKLMRGPADYNTVIPVQGMFNKANGFFYREPSGFSYIMALGILLEMHGRKRLVRLGAMGLALIVSYSGTGILALCVGMMFPLSVKTVVRAVLVCSVAALIFVLFGESLNLDFTMKRINEFQSEHSSGYIRYVAPFRLIEETLFDKPWTFWFGHGPGSITRRVVSYQVFDPTWAKLVFEYGFVGFACFLVLFLRMLGSARVPASMRATFLVSWLFMGGHLLSPENNYLALGMVGFFQSRSMTWKNH